MDFPRGMGEPPLAHDPAARAGKVIPFPPPEEERPAAAAAETGAAPAAPPRLSAIELWALRLRLVTFVLFCTLLGMFLVVIPWTPLWTENNLFLGYPQLRDWLNTGFVRGMAAGFGLLDILVGVREAVLYNEPQA